MIFESLIVSKNHRHMVQCVISYGLILWRTSATRETPTSIHTTPFVAALTSTATERAAISCKTTICYPLFVLMRHKMLGEFQLFYRVRIFILNLSCAPRLHSKVSDVAVLSLSFIFVRFCCHTPTRITCVTTNKTGKIKPHITHHQTDNDYD